MAEQKKEKKAVDSLFRDKLKSSAPASEAPGAPLDTQDEATRGDQPSILEKAFYRVADAITAWIFRILAMFMKEPPQAH